MNTNEQMRSSFEEFLQKFPCAIWLTVTFKNPVQTYTARKRFKYFLKHLNKDMIFYEKYIYLWAFYEKEKTREGVHIHACIDGIDSSKAVLLKKECLKFFGSSEVKAAHEGVWPYVAEKYNSFDLDDYEYMKINSKFRKFNSRAR